MPYKDPEKRKEYMREYGVRNRTQISENHRRWVEKNADKEAVRSKLRYQENKQQIIAGIRKFRRENPEKHRENCRRWERTSRKNPENRIKNALRGRIYKALRGLVKSDNSKVLVGCSISHLKAWLEFWMKPGMTWENYGQWHIDHKKPCVSFDLTKPEEQRKCFHYTNLEPLWAADNLRKGARV